MNKEILAWIGQTVAIVALLALACGLLVVIGSPLVWLVVHTWRWAVQ